MNNKKLLFKAIVGSQSYGLETPTSDIDIKGVYIQDRDDLLVDGKYEPHYEVNKDETYYELRNFLKLLSVGNPTAIELLFTPIDCILETTSEFNILRDNRSLFVTKKLYNSYGGYAAAQLKKAKGLDKKFNWEKSRIERKDILDFCTVLGRNEGKSQKLNTFLEEWGIHQKEIGLTKVDGFRDTYKLYITPNPATQGVVYRGVMKEDSNEVRVSEIPKKYADNWMGSLYFNREAYSTHCKDYKSYKKWEEERNESRYKESREGQLYDSKNIMHTARLVMTIEKIHEVGTLNLDMSEHKTELLAIKHGKVNLEAIFAALNNRVKRLDLLKKESTLNEEVDMELVNDLELYIRNSVYYGK